MSVSFKSKMTLVEARELAGDLLALLRQAGIRHAQVCGSVRRQRPEVGDLDLVVDGDLPRLRESPHWRWADGGSRKATLEFRGRQVNLLKADEGSWGSAVLYFTGPQGYNIGMRALAKGRGLKLNERGLWRGDERVAGETEMEIYGALGKEYRIPEERG